MKFKQLLILVCILLGCATTNDPETSDGSVSDTLTSDRADATEFPKVIDGGRRIVYQFSKMTPRGPHYFLDTVEYKDDVSLPLLGANFLFPLQLSAAERDTADGILAISLPGYFDETIIGTINHQWLRMQLKGTEILLSVPAMPAVPVDTFNVIFTGDSLRAQVQANLLLTQTGTHRAGRGTLKIFEHNNLLQTCDIFLVIRLD